MTRSWHFKNSNQKRIIALPDFFFASIKSHVMLAKYRMGHSRRLRVTMQDSFRILNTSL